MVARLERRTAQLELIGRKYWTIRRFIFLAGGLLSLFLCRYFGAFAGWVLAGLWVVTFSLVAFYHRRVRESIARNSVMMNIKQTQMARIRLDWDHLPRSVEAAAVPGHPFETDLDITGARSLHRLLDSAVTSEGSERLRSWLLNTVPDPLVIKDRQALVRELSGHSLFRDKLQLFSAITGSDARGKKVGEPDRWESNKLVAWIQPDVGKASLLTTVRLLALLAALNITLFVLNLFGLAPAIWPIVFLLYLGVMISKYGQIATAWDELQELEKALLRFRRVFQYLEARRYGNTPGLAKICEPFTDKAQRPSAELKRLGRLASALGLRTNALLWLLIHAFVPWDFYFSHRLLLLQREVAHLLPRWLDAWHELEALNSLANFAYLHPGYVFPEITVADSVFEARALGHPLLQPGAKVCNDFESGEQHRIAVLTGSNMAGKSTFLRTVGVNLCLGYAGAPVNAERLCISLFRVFTCIKVSDSVQDGFSYFYAEVKRLKALLFATEIAVSLPLLFLIDEIFRGTNSRERLIGSRAYIRTLANRSTVGIVATHDLELIKLADEIPNIANFHFRDDVREGKMVFDYRLRPGPCPTTNALLIMRMEGLPVDV